VKNIIAALQANPATTESQLASLQALDQQIDAAFEAAAASTDAEVAAAPAAPAPASGS
jgi:peptidoglycan hydrolase CwlO-like protein